MDRRSYCYNCGEDLGPWDRFSDQLDTCGRTECNRAAADAIEAERQERHDEIDREYGYW